MDRVDQDYKSNAKYKETALVTESLDNAPYISYESTIRGKVIKFGNTDFFLDINPSGNTFDFVPENQFEPKNNAAKYATILGVSLLELHKLLNSPEKLSDLGIDEKDVTEVSAFTNPRLIDGIKKLFVRYDAGDLISTRNIEGMPLGTSHEISINLTGFKQLGEESPLIKFLENVSKRAMDLKVTSWKEVDS